MNRNELNAHAPIFKRHLTTFLETSKAKSDDTGYEDKYCLPLDIEIEAVDFDAVQREWYAAMRTNGGKAPCSVDAIYFADGKTYAVEFKSGTNVAAESLIRKIYDTVISLIEKESYTIQKCREKIEYLVVAALKDTAQNKLNRRVATYLSRPWEVHGWDRWKLFNLEGVIVSKVYVIPPDFFMRFAKAKHWTS